MIWLVLLLGMYAIVSQQRAVAAGRLASAIATWLQAGRTPLEALVALRDSTDAPAIARGLNKAVNAMEAGSPLSHALATSGLVLPRSFLEGLRAVEESGHVADWLSLEAERFAWRAEVRGKGMLGLVYPLLVLFLVFESATFLLTYILPTFVSLLEGMNLDIPGPTSALRAFRWLATTHGQQVVGAVIFIAIVSITYPRQVRLGTALTRLPLMRRFHAMAGCEEAASMLGALMRGRLSLPAALHTAALAVPSPEWRQVLSASEKDVLAGESFSASLRRQPQVPRLFVDMCELGERAEDLPRTLSDLGSWYQEQLERFTHRAVRLGEVALMYSVGLVVAGYALAVWLPMARVLGSMVP